MTYDAGIGILCRQFLEEGEHGSLLGFSPGIVGPTFFIKTAFIANAEGTTVVVTGVGSTDILWENGDDGAVATDVVVVGGLAEAGHAGGDQVLDTEGAVAVRGATVDDEQSDCVVLEFFHICC